MAGVLDARGPVEEIEQEHTLELISEDSFDELAEILLQDVPKSLPTFGMVENVIRWRKIPNVPPVQKLYAPFGDFKSGTCVGIYDTDSFQAFTFYTRDVKDRKLQEALLSSSLINWGCDDKKKCTIREVSEDFLPMVKEITSKKNIKMLSDPLVHLWMEKDQAIKLEVRCPLGVKLGPLTTDHVPLLDQYWPFKATGSQDYLRTLLEQNFGIGVFVEGNEMPVSWIALNHNSCMIMLYTMEAHRQKGYAELVSTAMARKLAEMDIYPRVTVLEDNHSSKKLFTKIGFKSSHVVHYVRLEGRQ